MQFSLLLSMARIATRQSSNWQSLSEKAARFGALRRGTGEACSVVNSVLADAPIAVPVDITLVPIAVEHAEGCYRACLDQEIMRWLPLPQPYTLEPC
jgi:hypothetical protein